MTTMKTRDDGEKEHSALRASLQLKRPGQMLT